MLPRKALQHSGPELFSRSFETESSSKQQSLTDETIQKLSARRTVNSRNCLSTSYNGPWAHSFYSRSSSPSALHASYHEAIAQLERGFIRCELPNEAPALDSG